MKKTLLKLAIFIVAVIAAVMATFALADERVDDLIDAWNRGDSLAVQHHIHGDYTQASIGHAAEQGGRLRVLQHRFTGNGYEIELLVDDKPETWLLTECTGELSTYFCDWRRSGSRQNSFAGFGGAERGQAFDVATSGLGLGLGFTEANPLGLAILPLKAGAIHYANQQPHAECVTWRTWLDSLGIGAGVANLITIAAGVAPAVSVAALVAVTAWRYNGAHDTAQTDCAGRSIAKGDH